MVGEASKSLEEEAALAVPMIEEDLMQHEEETLAQAVGEAAEEGAGKRDIRPACRNRWSIRHPRESYVRS